MFYSVFKVKPYQFEMEYMNANDFIDFCLKFIKKMPRNPIKIRSCAIFGGLTCLTSFRSMM